MIEVVFFASLREALGCDREQLALPSTPASVAQVRALLAARGGTWQALDDPGRPLMVAVNQTLCDADTPLHDGDQLAIFPPVTGG